MRLSPASAPNPRQRDTKPDSLALGAPPWSSALGRATVSGHRGLDSRRHPSNRHVRRRARLVSDRCARPRRHLPSPPRLVPSSARTPHVRRSDDGADAWRVGVQIVVLLRESRVWCAPRRRRIGARRVGVVEPSALTTENCQPVVSPHPPHPPRCPHGSMRPPGSASRFPVRSSK